MTTEKLDAIVAAANILTFTGYPVHSARLWSIKEITPTTEKIVKHAAELLRLEGYETAARTLVAAVCNTLLSCKACGGAPSSNEWQQVKCTNSACALNNLYLPIDTWQRMMR